MDVFVVGWSAWAPGLDTPAAWDDWCRDRGALSQSADAPALAYVDPLFKRRLSQLTRMTIEVGHRALAGRGKMGISFASVYGEVGQQYKISNRLIAEGEVSPANFSLSVFNTPVAALSIAEGIVEGYTACYPGPDCLSPALVEASAAVASGAERERLLIVADELLPADYVSLQVGPNIPFALALVLSSVSIPGAICLNPADPWTLAPTSRVGDEDPSVPEPLRFLRSVLVPAGVPGC